MEQQTAAICISIYGRCEADRAHWNWLAVDGDEQSLAEEQGVAEPNPEVGANEAHAIATLSALRWAREQELQDVVLCIDDQEFVCYLTGEATPSPYLAVLIAPILPLVEEVSGSVECVAAYVPTVPAFHEPGDDQAIVGVTPPQAQRQVVQDVEQWLAAWPTIRGKLAPLIALDADVHAVPLEALAQVDTLIATLATLIPESSR
ncbi:MAG: hypothetical protein H0X37_12585 [Herpetosiphonaceae bacterium]|nr:hypothetical protein [Herpetosiphonaceae bacterium]